MFRAHRQFIPGPPPRSGRSTAQARGRDNRRANSGGTTLSQTRTATDANEIASITNTTGDDWAQPSYDAAGNMTTSPLPAGGGQGEGRQGTCTYDAWNRLASVSDGTTTVSYSYDGTGRMIERTSGAGVTHYYYAGQQMIETRDAAALPNRTTGTNLPENLSPHYQYVWSAVDLDAPILRDDLSTGSNAPRLYYLTDANDNVTALVGLSGGVWQPVERYVYDAYGNVTIYNGTWSGTQSAALYNNSVLYTGQQQDPETGLYYCRARWYNPSTGDWITTDPAQSDPSLYRYVGDDPISLQDPSGLAVYGRPGGPVWTAPGQPVAPQQPGGPPAGPCSGAGASADAMLQYQEQENALGALAGGWGGGLGPDSLTNVPPSYAPAGPAVPPNYVRSEPLGTTGAFVRFDASGQAWYGGSQVQSIRQIGDGKGPLDDFVSNTSWWNAPGKIGWGVIAGLMPGSAPDYEITFRDGSKMTVLGGGPSSGAMANQWLSLLAVGKLASAGRGALESALDARGGARQTAQSLLQDEAGCIGGAPSAVRSLSERIADFRANPQSWQRVIGQQPLLCPLPPDKLNPVREIKFPIGRAVGTQFSG